MGTVRNSVAVVAGMVVAGGVVAAVEGAAHGRVTGDALFAVVAVGYGLAAVAGAAVTTMLGARRLAVVMPIVLGVLAAINLLSFAHPIWFAPVAVVALVAGGWLGTTIRSSR